MKTAFVTGANGQDGAYLIDLLLQKGYRVIGGLRRKSSEDLQRLDYLGITNSAQLTLVPFELGEPMSVLSIIERYEVDEVYNLAAQSFVSNSFSHPFETSKATGLGCLNVLEAIRQHNSEIRFYQASTSEMFGKVQELPQSESTPFYPRSPYGVAKLYAHWMTVNYRESYGMFGASGILFNHESPLRGLEFVTRKITDGVARIKNGLLDVLELGNLDAKRDWGFARDYVEGMWRMLQADEPDTYVLATGRTETVRDFVRLAFKAAAIDIEFSGAGEEEIAVDSKSGQTVVRVNPQFYRPAEVDLLIGDPSKAERELGWRATTTLEELCQMMVEADLQRVQDGRSL